MIAPLLLACGGPTPSGGQREAAGGSAGDGGGAGAGTGGSGGIEVERVDPPPLDEPGPGNDGPDGDAGPLPDGAAPDLVPCLVEFPEAIDFGPVEKGAEVVRELAIRNLRDDAACRVTGLRALPQGAPEFSVQPVRQHWIPPGGELRVEVRFRPTHFEAEFSSYVEFDAVGDTVASVRHAVPLSGICRGMCLLVAPDSLDFGLLGDGCSSRSREVQVINVCSTPVQLEAAELAGADASAFELGPTSLPVGIAAGAAVFSEVAFAPPEPGEYRARLRFTGRDLDLGRSFVYEALLAGEAVEREPVTDRFEQPTLPEVDILVVIDNGTTMGPESARILAELGPLPTWFDDWDYHLAVTTTGVAAQPGGGCPGGASGGEDGRLFPVDGARPRIVTRTTPGGQAAWEANLAVGTCHTALPQGLEAAVRALTAPLATSSDDARHPEPADGNLGFLRQAAHLVVIFVSDRADASPGSDELYFQALQGLKGYRNTHLLAVTAVTGDAPAGCSAPDGRSAVSGQRLAAFAARTEGGEAVSICGGGPWFPRFVTGGPGLKTCLHLSQAPADIDGDGLVADADLEVVVNGGPVPSTKAGEPVWSYREEAAAVCFAPDHVPPPGATMEVTYLPSCSGS